MNRERAIEIARMCAKVRPQSYYSEPFQPHEWVIDAIIEAAAQSVQPAPEAGELAQRFHEAYERLAPSFGYETRKESAKPWSEVPEQNKRLMTAVCAEILRCASPVAPRGEVTLHATHAQMVQIHGHWNRLATFATAQAPADEELWHTIEAIADIIFREWPLAGASPVAKGARDYMDSQDLQEGR